MQLAISTIRIILSLYTQHLTSSQVSRFVTITTWHSQIIVHTESPLYISFCENNNAQ